MLLDRSLLTPFIPLDKSWIIRLGVLDILNGPPDRVVSILLSKQNISSDLRALLNTAENWWHADKRIYVGESATLYRILCFASWKLGLPKELVREGTLKQRSICNDPAIVDWPQQSLLTLDNGTSQWATAAVLMGDKEHLTNAPYKLNLTYEAVDYWHEKQQQDESWEPRLDETIRRQASTYLALFHGERPEFIPLHSEDYCFARAFGYIGPDEGEELWPSLRKHESDRIAEMEIALRVATRSDDICSNDHRVVQAIAMLLSTRGRKPHIQNPKVVEKSWPLFWSFLQHFKR